METPYLTPLGKELLLANGHESLTDVLADHERLRVWKEKAINGEHGKALRNLHAEMLEALKKCYEYFDDRYDGAPDGGCQAMVEPMEAARIAISKAEAK